MSLIELVLAKPESVDDELSLLFQLRDTAIAKKYGDALAASQQLSIYNPHRFYNFPNSGIDRQALAERINQCVAAVNGYAPGLITVRAEAQMDQDRLNRLHHYFEILRGPVLAPAEFMRRAPLSVKLALEQLNLAIHHFESYERNELATGRGTEPSAAIVVTFDRRQRQALADEDYAHFTKQTAFGSWHINYCEVGKPLWDVYQDQDKVIGDANVRPLRYYSPDAAVDFGPTKTAAEHAAMREGLWTRWTENEPTLRRLGFERGDPKNAIGSIPVADLIRDRGAIAGKSDAEIRTLIGRHQYVCRVVFHEDHAPNDVRSIFEMRIVRRLAKRPDLARRINGSYQISLSGAGGGTWVIDLTKRDTGEVRQGTLDTSEIKMRMSVPDFLDLSRGKLETQMAIVQGKLQFEGPLRLALELRQLIG
jgi:hypothetical protein